MAYYNFKVEIILFYTSSYYWLLWQLIDNKMVIFNFIPGDFGDFLVISR